MMKKTIIIGASPNPARYSYRATKLLKEYKHTVIPVGIRKGQIDGENIILGLPIVDNIHTISLYVGYQRQAQYYNYIIDLKPKRLVFNPGTENKELYDLAKKAGIEVVEYCTLIMLNSGIY